MIILVLRNLNYFIFSKLMGPLIINICLRVMNGPIVSVQLQLQERLVLKETTHSLRVLW